jgi:hypothetical protein
MSSHFKIEERDRYLCLVCSGVFEKPEDLLKVVAKGFFIAEEKGFKAILLDFRGLKGALPTFEKIFNFSEGFAKIQTNSKVYFVVAVGQEPYMKESGDRLGETVATNRGANLKIFTDYNAAISCIEEWIEEYRYL